MQEGRLTVFRPNGEFVTEAKLPPKISERPCRIDTDSKGHVYIAARPQAVASQPNIDYGAHPYSTALRYAALKYTPSSYPPTARTEYGRPMIFATGGEYYGLAVDPSNDHVYVASGPTIEFGPNGVMEEPVNEIQRVIVISGIRSFSLISGGKTTRRLPAHASASRVSAALSRLLGPDRVAVSRDAFAKGFSYVVEFKGERGRTDTHGLQCQADAAASAANECRVRTLRNGSGGAIGFGGRDVDVWGRTHDVYVSAEGRRPGEWTVKIYRGDSHKLEETISDVSGEPLGPYPSIAVDQANGNVFVEDFKSHRVVEYGRDPRSGKFRFVGEVRHGRALNRVKEIGSDLAVDGSPRSPNQGNLYATSVDGPESHVWSFAPKPIGPESAE